MNMSIERERMYANVNIDAHATLYVIDANDDNVLFDARAYNAIDCAMFHDVLTYVSLIDDIAYVSHDEIVRINDRYMRRARHATRNRVTYDELCDMYEM